MSVPAEVPVVVLAQGRTKGHSRATIARHAASARSFTGRAVTDARTAAIVAGTVELAHRLGLRLVAEGVHDEATWQRMAELGCDESQGYLHSGPLPPDAFLEWLTRAASSPAPRQASFRR